MVLPPVTKGLHARARTLQVAHSFIGDAFVRGLSGGEKRRVSIAVELLCAPGLLLLDEPTTGLDSTNAARVVDIMARLAREGVTVLMSIHQPRPDIFRLMDRLLLLSSEGQVGRGTHVFACSCTRVCTHCLMNRLLLLLSSEGQVGRGTHMFACSCTLVCTHCLMNRLLLLSSVGLVGGAVPGRMRTRVMSMLTSCKGSHMPVAYR